MDIYDQLKRDEGLKLFPYTDTVGKLTIGVGRNLIDKGITADEADTLLHNDVAEIQAHLANSLPWFIELNQPRQGALINMGFNLGVAGLLAFHNTLTLLEAGDYNGAAKEILNSRWAGQVGARATRISEQIRLGSWQ